MYGKDPTIDYFAVLNELNNKSTTEQSKKDLKAIFYRTLEKKSFVNDQQQTSLKLIDECFRSVVPSKDLSPPDFKSIYDSFIALFKEKNSVEVQVTFMRYLSLYMGSSIPHSLFVRLYYQLLGKPSLDNPLISGLPTFLAAILFNSFAPPKAHFSSRDEAFAAEIIITVTANSTTAESSHSIYKCFKLLSESYISPRTAQKWLSNYASEEVLYKLLDISDFSFFHPSKIPHEFILCADFCDELNEKQRAQEFDEKSQNSRKKTPFELVPFETLENQLQSIKNLIDLLARGEKPTAERLLPFFGSYTQQILPKCPAYNPLAIRRLSELYNELYSKYKSFSLEKIGLLKNDYIEYRTLYKRILKNLYDPVHFLISGMHEIELGTEQEIKDAQQLIQHFIDTIFGNTNKEQLRNGIQNTAKILNGNIYIAQPYYISYLTALSELIRIIRDCSKIDEIPEKCKTENGLKELFPDNIDLQCVDLVLIKIARQLNKAQQLEEYNFVTATSQGMFISALEFKDEKVVVETRLSPFYKPETD